jgi:hypothetical protein
MNIEKRIEYRIDAAPSRRGSHQFLGNVRGRLRIDFDNLDAAT